MMKAIKTASLSGVVATSVLFLASCGDLDAKAYLGAPGTAEVNRSVTVTIPSGATGKGSAAYGANPSVVSAGSMVVWQNSDSVPHTATSDTGQFDTGTIAPGQSSMPISFPTPGTFPYHCTIHGAQSMSGTIQVVGPTPSPSASSTGAPGSAPMAR